MSEQEMISVAFITPICLLTLTSLVLVARIGVKAAVTRAFELEDGKQTGQREFHASAPPVDGTLSDHISIWNPPLGASPGNTQRYLGVNKEGVASMSHDSDGDFLRQASCSSLWRCTDDCFPIRPHNSKLCKPTCLVTLEPTADQSDIRPLAQRERLSQ